MIKLIRSHAKLSYEDAFAVLEGRAASDLDPAVVAGVERLGPVAIEPDALEPDALEPGHVTFLFDTTSVAYMVEIRFDRFALGGDLHPARAVAFGVSFGPTNLWPAAAENGALGTLLF